MNPQVEFLDHWFLTGVLLSFANENPMNPVVSIGDAASRANIELDRAKEVAKQCINFGVISARLEKFEISDVSITPLGVYLMSTDREMRAGRDRGPQFTLPDGVDQSIYAIQMGYEEVRSQRLLNPYRTNINLQTLDYPFEKMLEKLDDAVEAIRSSNSISEHSRREILDKLEQGRKRFSLGFITIAALSMLILNPLQEAINLLSEEILKPRIEQAAKII